MNTIIHFFHPAILITLIILALIMFYSIFEILHTLFFPASYGLPFHPNPFPLPKNSGYQPLDDLDTSNPPQGDEKEDLKLSCVEFEACAASVKEYCIFRDKLKVTVTIEGLSEEDIMKMSRYHLIHFLSEVDFYCKDRLAHASSTLRDEFLDTNTPEKWLRERALRLVSDKHIRYI